MGVTILSKNNEMDLGCVGFFKLRLKVAELTNKEIYNLYKKLNDMPIASRDRREFCQKYDVELNSLANRLGKKENAILEFLYASNDVATISVEVCKYLFDIIKGYDDNIAYGYIGKEDCATFKDFKRIVKDCIDTNTVLTWY